MAGKISLPTIAKMNNIQGDALNGEKTARAVKSAKFRCTKTAQTLQHIGLGAQILILLMHLAGGSSRHAFEVNFSSQRLDPP